MKFEISFAIALYKNAKIFFFQNKFKKWEQNIELNN